MKQIASIDFRSKVYGAGKYILDIKDTEGNHYNSRDCPGDKGIFYRMFLRNTALQDSCCSCSFRLENSMADIRIGDYWKAPDGEDFSGGSAVLAFTDQGKEILSELKSGCVFLERDVKTVSGRQLKDNIPVPEFRKKFLSALSCNSEFSAIRRLFLSYERKLPLKSRIEKLRKIFHGMFR